MPGPHCVPLPRLTRVSLLALLILAAACSSGPVLTPTPQPDATPTPLPLVEPDILRLPERFRYEIVLRLAGASAEPATVITGQYRAGALAQSARRGEDAAEELVIAPDPADGVLRSYTHAPGEASWTRWPGVGFDAVFGLASPFSALRLYPLADERAAGEPEALLGAPEATIKLQTGISTTTIERLLKAGASAVAVDAEQRRSLEFQLAPLLIPQTITYWATAEGRVYQAAATLLIEGTDRQPIPWLEVIWRYWGYNDPSIAVLAPAEFSDVADLAPAADAATQAGIAPLSPETTLRVRIFANPGVSVTEATITIYPARKNQALATVVATDAQFVLPDGVYDVQVRAEGAETWLREVKVVAGALVSHDVLFDFGTLALTVLQDGVAPQVDMVIYPAGQRETWLAWRSENPTVVRLPAGLYDVEIALPDHSATRRIESIQVQGGETVEVKVELGK